MRCTSMFQVQQLCSEMCQANKISQTKKLVKLVKLMNLSKKVNAVKVKTITSLVIVEIIGVVLKTAE